MRNPGTLWRRGVFVLALAVVLLSTSASMAMYSFSLGNDPLNPQVAERFPMGIDKVANIESRLGHSSGPGGGLNTFEYTCESTEEFNEALKLFAAVRTPKRELVVHDGNLGFSTIGTKEPVTWTLSVRRPDGWHSSGNHPTLSFRLEPERFGKPVPPPRVDVYLGTGVIDWKQVKVPRSVTLIDKRLSAAKFKPQEGAMVYGDVYDMSTGRPVAGVKVWFVQYDPETRKHEDMETRTESGPLGEYHLEVAAPKGTHYICFSKPGYSDRTERLYVKGGLQFKELSVELVSDAVIQGVVVDVAGNPVAGVPIGARDIFGMDGRRYRYPRVSPIQSGATSDSEGRFEIKTLPNGYTRLYSTNPDVHMKPDIDLYKVPSKDARLVVEGTGAVRGKVIEIGDKPRGGRVDMFIKALDPDNTWGGMTSCEEDGSFAFKKVPPGRYKLSTQILQPHVGDDLNAKVVEVKAGGTANVEVKYSTGRDLVQKYR